MRKQSNYNWQQRAQKITSHLLNPGANLKETDAGKWGLFVPGKRGGRALMHISTSELVVFQKADLIRIAPDGRARLTDAGEKWNTRLSAVNDPFAKQHQDRVFEELRTPGDITQIVEINQSESPLYWLYRRKDKSGKRLLSEQQFAAGERLRRDFTKSHMAPKTTSSWSPTSGGTRPRRKHGARATSGAEHSDNAIAARTRFNQAIEAVGPEFADVLIEICCFLRGVEDSETKFGWPRRSGKLVLQLALSSLARHYDGQSGNRQTQMPFNFWAQADYKPIVPPPE